MRKAYIFIALAMVAALSMVSCKCTSKKSQEPTQEEVQEMKQALADSVLADIDAFVEEYCIAYEKSFRVRCFKLTEAEKLVKPDYLLDPSEANNFVTKSQKVNALAIYVVELSLREVYDMPTETTREAIAKLLADLNYPYDIDQRDANLPISERIRQEYNKCKENGDLTYFWQFQNAITAETGYILAQNPELFFSKITEEQWQQYAKRTNEKNMAMKELAKYDEEMAAVLELFNQTRVVSEEEKARISDSIESEMQNRIANKDKYIAKRNALLQ